MVVLVPNEQQQLRPWRLVGWHVWRLRRLHRRIGPPRLVGVVVVVVAVIVEVVQLQRVLHQRHSRDLLLQLELGLVVVADIAAVVVAVQVAVDIAE